MKRTIIDPSQFELNDNVVAIKRVSKTVKGGRTMRFSALVVVGDGNGHVGAGLGKAGEVPEAIRKGREAAMKNLVEIPVDENKSIPHDHICKCLNFTLVNETAAVEYNLFNSLFQCSLSNESSNISCCVGIVGVLQLCLYSFFYSRCCYQSIAD